MSLASGCLASGPLFMYEDTYNRALIRAFIETYNRALIGALIETYNIIRAFIETYNRALIGALIETYNRALIRALINRSSCMKSAFARGDLQLEKTVKAEAV
jgi:hypothetical protein